MNATLEVQDEKWRLEMNDEFGGKWLWELFDLSKGALPIDRNPVNDKSAIDKKEPCKEQVSQSKEQVIHIDRKEPDLSIIKGANTLWEELLHIRSKDEG